jgi:hypothetical protein
MPVLEAISVSSIGKIIALVVDTMNGGGQVLVFRLRPAVADDEVDIGEGLGSVIAPA